MKPQNLWLIGSSKVGRSNSENKKAGLYAGLFAHKAYDPPLASTAVSLMPPKIILSHPQKAFPEVLQKIALKTCTSHSEQTRFHLGC